MVEMSFLEKLSALIDIILPSPFFLALLVIAIFTAAILIVNTKIKNKWVKLFTALSYLCIIIYIFIEYGASVLELSDNLVDKVFNAVYFPNLITYVCMLIIAILLFIRAMIDKKIPKLVKYTSIFTFCIMMFLFVLTLDTIVKSGLDITDKTAIYTNESLVVLIQSSTAIFAIWCIILAIDFIVTLINNHNSKKTSSKVKHHPKHKTNLDDKAIKAKLKQLENLNVTTEFTVLSEEGFKESFNKYKKKKDYNEYLKIIDNDNKNTNKKY